MDPLDAGWHGGGDRGEELTGTVDALVRLVLAQRTAARERKDYGTADAIRDELTAAGLVIEDTPTGPGGSWAERARPPDRPQRKYRGT